MHVSDASLLQLLQLQRGRFLGKGCGLPNAANWCGKEQADLLLWRLAMCEAELDQ